jgi:two-component system, sensor histidine kinase YesM
LTQPPINNEGAPRPSGIYREVLVAFATVISILVVLVIVLTTFQSYIISQHTIILNNLLYEGRFSRDTPKLINDFYGLTMSYSKGRLNTYQLTKERLTSTISSLDLAVTDNKSKIAYLGVRNIAESIIKDCEEGLQAGLRGDQISAAKKYDSAIRKNSFIEGNSVSLILAEMDYAETLVSRLNTLSKTILYVSIILFIGVFLWIVMFVKRFSESLSQPLIDLAAAAGKIEGGDFDISISTGTLKHNDELAILGKSFNSMATRLKSSMEEINQSNANLEKVNADLEENKKKVEGKNEELSKLNHFMVDRELKMIELKKRIEELEGKK